MPENYSVPTSGSDFRADFGLVIFRWESFRIAYNVILVFLCLAYTLMVQPANLSLFDYWFCLAFGALVANALFLTGPAVDGYLSWYGVWTAPIALVLFFLGTLATAYYALDWISRY